MWIVKVALGRPYTFIVLALLLLILGPLSIVNTAKDIFPNIGIPVVSVIWTYSGLPPEEMSGRITGGFERVSLVAVNNVDHIESQSLTGVSVIKYFFHPGTNVDLPMAQLTAVSQAWLKQLPPGITPPLILAYNASSVPIIQLALSSNSIPEQGLYDLANNFVRTQLAGVAGASIPFPYGGKQRQVQVDLDQHLLQERGLSADEVVNAINAQNLIIPAGTEKVGEFEYNIKLNGSPIAVDEFNDLPIKNVNGTVVYVHDVAHVRDGSAPQTNVVRVDGQHASLMTIQKTGDASTLDIIEQIKDLLPAVRNASPPALDIKPIGDQSVFVKAAIDGVVREGVIAAALTGLMILLFLGSWRSTLIITISIPLSVLASIAALSALGQTINIMTLGGWRSPSASWSMTRRSRSRASTPIWKRVRVSKRRFSTAPARFPCRRWLRRCASASSSCRCSSSPASRAISSSRWPRRSSSPCSLPMCCRARWFRPSPNIGSGCMRAMKRRPATRWPGCSAPSITASKAYAGAITAAWSAPSPGGRCSCRSSWSACWPLWH